MLPSLQQQFSMCYMRYILCLILRKAILQGFTLFTILPEAVRLRVVCNLCSPRSCLEHDYILYLQCSCLPEKSCKYNLWGVFFLFWYGFAMALSQSRESEINLTTKLPSCPQWSSPRDKKYIFRRISCNQWIRQTWLKRRLLYEIDFLLISIHIYTSF